MTLLQAFDWLEPRGAKLSLVGAQVGRIHVRGVELPKDVVEAIASHRELVSLLLVQEYGCSGQVETEVSKLARQVRSFVVWLRSLPPTANFGRTQGDTIRRQLAVAMLQDMGVDACDVSGLAGMLDGAESAAA